jgi:hypothetical protein
MQGAWWSLWVKERLGRGGGGTTCGSARLRHLGACDGKASRWRWLFPLHHHRLVVVLHDSHKQPSLLYPSDDRWCRAAIGPLPHLQIVHARDPSTWLLACLGRRPGRECAVWHQINQSVVMPCQFPSRIRTSSLSLVCYLHNCTIMAPVPQHTQVKISFPPICDTGPLHLSHLTPRQQYSWVSFPGVVLR